MDQIHRLGWRSIGGSFSEYSPAHIYLLNLVSWIPDPVTAVKLLNVPFIVSLAMAVDRLSGRTGATVVLCLPSLLINAFAIGQCDVIYVSFLVWFVVFAEQRRPLWCALMFGLAFSFKAQAMFLSPAFLYLLLSGRVKVWHTAMVPIVYCVLMIPAAIAGRPWSELLTVYLHQTQLRHILSLNAPNPWWIFQAIVDYRTGLIIGLGLGATLAFIIAVWGWRRGAPILTVAAIAAVTLPFVLPKMTERYFFVADIMTLALAFRNPQTWPIAALVQISSVLASLTYLTGLPTTTYATIPITIAVGLILVFALSERGTPHVPVAKRVTG
jgi:Gpi18-like mannosyltransferase